MNTWALMGFGCLGLSCAAKKRSSLLGLEILGSLCLLIYWLGLEAYTPAGMSVLYVLASFWALGIVTRPKLRKYYWLLLIVSLVFLGISYQRPADLLAATGTLVGITGRRYPLSKLRGFYILANFAWGLFGILVGAYLQAVFSGALLAILLYREFLASEEETSCR